MSDGKHRAGADQAENAAGNRSLSPIIRALAANILAVSLFITGCSDSTSGDKK